MKRSGFISLLLAFFLVFSAVAVPISANAEVNYSGLNKNQEYYLRLVGSLARADYYKTDVLASVTLTQAIYEGGWASYSLPIGGNNLFGIKAYSSWTGKVYDQTRSMLYDSYSDFLLALGPIRSNEVSAWRAHDSWGESVNVHSQLFTQNDSYAPVVGEKNYKTAFQAIVDGGYCNDNGYVENCIDILEQYGLTAYDDIKPDSDGIVALTADTERVFLVNGEKHQLNITYYPSNKKPSKITFASDNPKVATVDAKGNITAVSHGTALITATLKNGREACCIVYVDCNATIMDQNVNVRETPSVNAESLGKIYRGCAVKIASQTIHVDSQGNEFIYIKGCNSKGEIVKGYVLAEYVYKNKRNVSSITLVKDNITLVPKEKYTVVTAIAPIDAKDAKLTWTSSNTAVATVSAEGVVTAKAAGTATITAKASGGATVTLKVTVAAKSKEYRAMVSVTDSLRVRSSASWSGSSVGSVDFLSEIKVIGEPKGYWYEVKGTSNRGKEITGYVFSTYVKLLADNDTVTYFDNSSTLSVYEAKDLDSKKLGALKTGSKAAVIGKESDGWSFVLGKSASGDAIYGYVRLDGSGEIGTPPDVDNDSSSTENVTGWYGRVTTSGTLNIRDKASTSGAILGELDSGTEIVIFAEEGNWYKMKGEATSGTNVVGYVSADYVAVLYNGEVINIDDNLNVRAQPSTSGEIVGKLKNGTKLTVVGDALNNWYNIETDDITGYCSADYIKITGKITVKVDIPSDKPVTPPDTDTEEKFAITDSSISIKNGMLYGVGTNTEVATLLKKFNGNVSITDKNGKALASTAVVATGNRIMATQNGKTSVVAIVRIAGDVNGNGKIDSMDYGYIKRSFFKEYDLNGIYLQAAMVSGESKLTVLDYVMIKRAYYGQYPLS